MRKVIFRVLGGFLGVLLCLMPILVWNDAPEGSWPPWVIAITFFGSGVYFVHYAATGRETFYRRKRGE